ncbi:hypothetical protein H072_10097 [Dactylellina haptotyla CBS 200.50]|uniref:Uncharacterized protein n=1 Tax=Dactylellina haptotyla (strain CBS 200.50) TaxID=1284197 RepID=S8A125_DACHA|nr:hypothetical protein H072_10097 [Dactylellina haptotyla CBS 200.50]
MKSLSEDYSANGYQLPSETSSIGYLQKLPLYDKVKPYILNIPVFPEDCYQNVFMEYIHNIKISDIRPAKSLPTLDKNGFQLVEHETSLSYDDFLDKKTIYEKYFPESEALLKKATGASRVYIYEHQVRKRQGDKVDSPEHATSQPLTGAHCDVSPQCLKGRVRLHMGREAENLLQSRHQIINIWRPLKGPIKDFPLAVCDYNSIDVPKDFRKTDVIFPHFE